MQTVRGSALAHSGRSLLAFAVAAVAVTGVVTGGLIWDQRNRDERYADLKLWAQRGILAEADKFCGNVQAYFNYTRSTPPVPNPLPIEKFNAQRLNFAYVRKNPTLPDASAFEQIMANCDGQKRTFCVLRGRLDEQGHLIPDADTFLVPVQIINFLSWVSSVDKFYIPDTSSDYKLGQRYWGGLNESYRKEWSMLCAQAQFVYQNVVPVLQKAYTDAGVQFSLSDVRLLKEMSGASHPDTEKTEAAIGFTYWAEPSTGIVPSNGDINKYRQDAADHVNSLYPQRESQINLTTPALVLGGAVLASALLRR